jgi:hypothetical protein
LKRLQAQVAGLQQQTAALAAENAELKRLLQGAGRSSAAAALGQTNAVALHATLQPELAALRQQVQQQKAATDELEQLAQQHQEEAARLRAMLSSLGVQDADTALGQARMWDSTQQLAALGEQMQQQKTAIASLQQQHEAQQV